MCSINTPGMLSGPGAFVGRKESEGFVKDCGGEFAYDHVLCRGGVAGIASCQGNAPLGSMLEYRGRA